MPLLRQDETGVHYILPDQNDGPSEEVSAAGGALGWTARKGTWAEGWRHHGHAGGEPFLGQCYDAESGLHYNRFRYCDPDTGKYLSPDPLELAGGPCAYGTLRSPFEVYDRYGLSTDPACGANAPGEPEPVEPPSLTRRGGFFVQKMRLHYSFEVSSAAGTTALKHVGDAGLVGACVVCRSSSGRLGFRLDESTLHL